ncbi:phage GP46 family protein [Acidomonas methanolica]|nr:phage GP46 family protein [Acidomonas methanolica]MBU2653462.1 phage GP46 family protein [Acidomonas methanolica]
MAQIPFCSLRLGVNPALGVLDLVIDPIGNGRGRMAIDRTPATPLLIALGTDRRADADDVLPEMMTAPAGARPGLFAYRGWAGDICLPAEQRYGWKGWLLARAGNTEATRVAAADYAAQAVSPIAEYHGVEIDTSASWYDRARGILQITVSAAAVRVAQRVTAL